MRTEQFRGALLSALVIASLITPLLLLSPSPVHAALIPHAPILINGNGGFIKPDPVNGGGSGTVGDPYIIENYIINASTAHGIEIRNTTAHFVVRNCVVENGGRTRRGIYLDNVVNGKIENNTCSNNFVGIWLYNNSDNNTISNNTCENNNAGIRLSSSSNNTCENNRSGIHLWDSDNNTISNNTCENNSYGIALSGSDNNTISNNTCENHSMDGIYLDNSSNNTLSNNTCENNRSGIFLQESSNNTLSGNTCENNSYGIVLYISSDNNTLSNNTCENNVYNGICLYVSSNNNTIFHNYLLNNTENNAYDDGTNHWDENGEGNYWSDYTGEDADNGGIGDTPYNIPGGTNQDRYPLGPFVPEEIPPEEAPTRWPLIAGIVGIIVIIGIVAALYMRRRKPTEFRW